MLMVRRANMGLSIAANREIAKRHVLGQGVVADSSKDANLLMDGENFMSTSPAEVLEELKELRRHGDLNSGILLKAVQGLPLLSPEMASQVGGPGPEVLVRLLDIRTLAERVFGEGKKAESWLTRSNPSLSGQRPLDLLKDELGTAVVREMLERIDHGIFA